MGNFKATLDRIEGSTAVLLVRDEENVKLNFPLFLLPAGSREGDILEITIDKNIQETGAASERVSSLIEKLKTKRNSVK